MNANNLIVTVHLLMHYCQYINICCHDIRSILKTSDTFFYTTKLSIYFQYTMAEAPSLIIHTSFRMAMSPNQPRFIVNITWFPIIFILILYTTLITVPVYDIRIRPFFSVALQPKSGLGRLLFEVCRSHTIRHTYPAEFLWTSDQLVAEAATYTM
jgi:hypothetical protein